MALLGLTAPTALTGPADAAPQTWTQVDSISPASGPVAGGSTFTITGTDLYGNDPKATLIDFKGRLATNVNCTKTSCTGTVPAGDPGNGTMNQTVNLMVSIDTDGGAWSMTDVYYTYVVPPRVTGLSPNNGPVGGGNMVTITGTNLTGANQVTFGTKYVANGSCSSDTTCTMQAPAGTAGIVDVKVRTANGGWSTPTPASRYAYGVPTVTALSPNSGPTAGGNKVTLTGTNLAGATSVTFGPGRNATAVTCTATSCTATAPATPYSKVYVQVTTAAGTSATNPDQNLYLYQ
ncbi:IPT/TIG domain-containing protein [Streptomyces sp. NPDC058655]|uniref:IPT/TIG domain-containing protein n=1 Tax=Streptomyces sp. NPDC058655 TaxID=3346577 RepID=UPI00365B063C